jgi:hypothetical protein
MPARVWNRPCDQLVKAKRALWQFCSGDNQNARCDKLLLHSQNLLALQPPLSAVGQKRSSQLRPAYGRLAPTAVRERQLALLTFATYNRAKRTLRKASRVSQAHCVWPRRSGTRILHAAVRITRALGLVLGPTAHPFDAMGSTEAVEPAATLPAPALLLCVYRGKNAASVTRLVSQCRAAGMDVALWALHESIGCLAPFTVGGGAGLRMDLLNRLWATMSHSAYQHVVIADDDVVVADNSLTRIRTAVSRCGFGIAQPAHHSHSRYSYAITRQRWLALARHTTFVEPGPLFVVSAPWIRHVLPFPQDFGMGFGLWLLWQDLQALGCRLGIVDGVAIEHASAIASDYDPTMERARLRQLLRARGLLRPSDAQRTLGTWWAWEAEPSWTRRGV